jgi:hypothetical protein
MSDDDETDALSRNPTEEERRLQAKLDAGTITESEYARLTALRFGKKPDDFSFADAAAFFDVTEAELREEMAWLGGEHSDRPD